MTKVNYNEISCFKHIYLEDSYVLNIIAEPRKLRFIMEFVLERAHRLYLPPKQGESYFYKKGEIIFINTKVIQWENSEHEFFSTDINNEIDLGNIDAFYKEGDVYYLNGDWGNISATCQDIKVTYTEESY
ncbi:hypothetical protein EOD41_04430 [Mucilaginibacter limnophilus]|uniref:Uncharacterized protein n=1 Tax=Mucilaginibacter limnophilus TaxID=1932778 RepID=A0A3S2V8H1_9SPHI|nr:hypothetical protein [Mucilaginibacter limnophilus]RVU01218.1 hypothetical protein EOD41_04430 [Mucilaginibacter limnophilus]